ncbi:DNA polymerase IV [Paraburkholderia humisilvae]|uniref:DNA polymerase IV n=1 Tax=Paraburkholderia humisilvae TaxID=627669 RepID=A0A6J5FBX0_9BURK|nr:DNA polymerase IV [Paraburkholderia humisilvae]
MTDGNDGDTGAVSGVVTTSTYEARAIGVHPAMGIMKAAQLAPDAYRLPMDFDSYHHYSRLFTAAVRRFTDQASTRSTST